MAIWVKHAVGSSQYKAPSFCGCYDWHDHWRRATGSRRLTCVVIGCRNYAEVGAHIVEGHRRATTMSQWRIVGMCSSCNSSFRNENFPIDQRTWWADHAVLDTCGDYDDD